MADSAGTGAARARGPGARGAFLFKFVAIIAPQFCMHMFELDAPGPGADAVS